MKKIDSLGLRMCAYQAALFQMSKESEECSSKIFIRRFMNSELAKRMDNVGFVFESLDVSDAIKEIEEQYGASSYGVNKFDGEELYWIGYIYRYWSYISDKSSKQIYKLIKPEQLRKLYYPYHSMDPLQAIERITEELEPGTNVDISDISKGVIALRKVRRRVAGKQP